MSEYKSTFGRGDFLIANVIGADQQLGAIAIGNLVRAGRQFSFTFVTPTRLTKTSSTCWISIGPSGVRRRRPRCSSVATDVGLGCLRNHITMRRPFSECSAGSLAGFFAQGELGPVGGKNYIHGFTASVACFE